MGFPEERAKLALKHFRNNIDRAMDHLLNSPDDSALQSNGNTDRSSEG